jgi:endonuclease-3
VPKESRAERKKRAQRIARALRRAYPEARCALRFESPFQLLIATILRAVHDEMVNQVTAELFAGTRARRPGRRRPAEIERLVRRTGFFRQKAVDPVGIPRHRGSSGEVPPYPGGAGDPRGVARKTANLVLGTAFGVPASPSTPMKRVNRRLRLTSEDDPVEIERDLAELIPREEWTGYTHRVIQHGRQCCDARRPRCEACPLRADCPHRGSARGAVR